MKDRIMRYLDEFARGESNELAQELQKELALDPNTFQSHAREVLAAILHNYHQFSISTIDAFFQRVIRSFTREAGILGDYRLEVDQDLVMEEVVGNLIDELGTDDQLTQWVVELAKQNLENDRSWDMRQSLIGFSKEIFDENFKAIEESIGEKTKSKTYFKDVLKQLQKEKYEFTRFVQGRAKSVLTDFQSLGLSANDFKYGGGVYNLFVKLSEVKSVKDFSEEKKGKRAENEYQSSKNWPAKDSPHTVEIVRKADEKWIGQLNEIIEFRNRKFQVALSAEVALNNFYSFGLLSDISRKLAEYKKENNMMLLADAPQFLNGIIRDSDTPFIYEKAGSFYRNFLIDEFQDTSGLQWKNFQPLLSNGLDSGYPSMIVGDVKQAIYRWRGGDQTLLQDGIENELGSSRTEINLLNKNFRSAKGIVSFNNALFKESSTIVAAETGLSVSINEYSDVEQQSTKQDEGFVRVQFVEDDFDIKWRDRALTQMALHIEDLQLRGVKPGDIALLVRKNEDGQQVVSYLMNHKNSPEAKRGCNYDVVSSESLRIGSAGAVNLLTAALTYLLNPEDAIARAQLAYEFDRQQDSKKPPAEVFRGSSPVTFENILPPEFTSKKNFLRKLPLFELTETLIEIFELGTHIGELPYLIAFQDLVLDFVNREHNNLGAFLNWWNDNKYKKSIVAPSGANAMQIHTVHKAKGLQFNYVIIPFCSWSLDHEFGKHPNLWVRSNESIFNEIGYLPVKYSSSLKESLFADDYLIENGRVYLDNLNLLYVALTRAKKGLFVLASDASVKRDHNGSVAKLLYGSITGSLELSKNWNKHTKIWNSGEIVVSTEAEKATEKVVSLEKYKTTAWRSKMIVKQTARARTSEEDSQRQKINYGIYLHSALATITYASDIPKAITQLKFDGKINLSDEEILLKKFEQLLTNSLVADWFSPGWEVRNEAHSLLPGGKEYRIDRLLIKDKRAVVIDFKTGVAQKQDQHQVGEYCTMLNQMGFSSEGYLLYLNSGEIINVVPPKTPKTKKRSENQLDLGI